MQCRTNTNKIDLKWNMKDISTWTLVTGAYNAYIVHYTFRSMHIYTWGPASVRVPRSPAYGPAVLRRLDLTGMHSAYAYCMTDRTSAAVGPASSGFRRLTIWGTLGTICRRLKWKQKNWLVVIKSRFDVLKTGIFLGATLHIVANFELHKLGAQKPKINLLGSNQVNYDWCKMKLFCQNLAKYWRLGWTLLCRHEQLRCGQAFVRPRQGHNPSKI